MTEVADGDIDNSRGASDLRRGGALGCSHGWGPAQPDASPRTSAESRVTGLARRRTQIFLSAETRQSRELMAKARQNCETLKIGILDWAQRNASILKRLVQID